MTLEELQEIEAKAAQLRGIVFHLDSPVSAELEEFAIKIRPSIMKLCAALREAWADSHTLTDALKLGSEQYRVAQARIAELEGQLEFAEECLRWKSARIAELEAVAERRREIDMAQQCGAKQEGKR